MGEKDKHQFQPNLMSNLFRFCAFAFEHGEGEGRKDGEDCHPCGLHCHDDAGKDKPNHGMVPWTSS